MLAATLKSVDELVFPCFVQPKIDGHRAYKVFNETYTGRHGKDIENNFIRETLRAMPLDNVDGELIVPGIPFHECSGELRRHDSQPNFLWHIFDRYEPNVDFHLRWSLLTQTINFNDPLIKSRVSLVHPFLVTSVDEFEKYEAQFVSEGYEGIIIRSPFGKYKQGRSTIKEFYLVKYKRWLDDEAVITSFEEQNENTNSPVVNAFGQTERSKSLDGLRPKSTLGAFICTWKGKTLRVGTGEGLTESLRKEIWDKRGLYVGKKITFKYLPVGMKERPRQPIFKSFRCD